MHVSYPGISRDIPGYFLRSRVDSKQVSAAVTIHRAKMPSFSTMTFASAGTLSPALISLALFFGALSDGFSPQLLPAKLSRVMYYPQEGGADVRQCELDSTS